MDPFLALGLWVGIVALILGNYISVELRVIREGLRSFGSSLGTIEESSEFINERLDSIENSLSSLESEAEVE